MQFFTEEDKRNLVNEVKVKLEGAYNEAIAKLEKRAQEIENEAKKSIDEALSKVRFGPSTH